MPRDDSSGIGRIQALDLVLQERRSRGPAAPSPAPSLLSTAGRIPDARPATRTRVAVWAVAATGLVLSVALLLQAGIPGIVSLLDVAGWRLLWLVPLHLVPLAIGAAGWRCLVLDRRAPGLAYLTWAAVVREAVGGLLPVAQVGGDVAGIRLLLRRGVTGASASASVVVEVTLSMVVQLVFAGAGLILLLGYSTVGPVARSVAFGLLAGAVVIAAFVLVQNRYGLFGLTERVLGAVAGKDVLRLLGDPARLDGAIRALYGERGALAVSLAMQLAGMFAGALELWIALRLLGLPSGVGAAVVVESLTMATQSAAFFVPAGLGTQEGSFVLVGAAVGLSPEAALALSLATRARQLLLGIPALASWLWAERSRS